MAKETICVSSSGKCSSLPFDWDKQILSKFLLLVKVLVVIKKNNLVK